MIWTYRLVLFFYLVIHVVFIAQMSILQNASRERSFRPHVGGSCDSALSFSGARTNIARTKVTQQADIDTHWAISDLRLMNTEIDK